MNVAELIPWPVPIGWCDAIAAWAEADDIDPTDVIVKALTREQARREGRRMDERTRRPGRAGAASRIPTGMLGTADALTFTHLGPTTFARYVTAGLLTPSVPPSRAQPAGWSRADCAGLAACDVLAQGGMAWERLGPVYRFVANDLDLTGPGAARAWVAFDGADRVHLTTTGVSSGTFWAMAPCIEIARRLNGRWPAP